MTSLLLGWRHIRREWRSGELLALAMAVALAVAVMSAVVALGERVRQGLQRQAADFLAADLVVAGRDPIPPVWRQRAQALGLAASVTVSFPSVVFVGENSALAAIKGVESGYPLRGTLTLVANGNRSHSVIPPPAPGTVWIDPRLQSLLGSRVGEVIQVGDRDFRLAGIIAAEPDRGGNFFSLAPRLMMSRRDVAAAGLLGPGSRVTRRLLVAGDRAPLGDFRRWITPQLQGLFRLQDPETTQQQVGSALTRARRFLGLAALSAVFLSGVAVMLAAHRYSRRHRNSAAILRSLGASQSQVGMMLGGGVVALGLLAGIAGAIVGYGLQWALAHWVSDVLPVAQTSVGVSSVLPSIVAGAVVLLGFAVPPLWSLLRTPPMRVLQGGQGTSANWRQRMAGVLPLLAFTALVVWQAGDSALSARVLGGFSLLLGFLAGLAWLMLRLLRHFSSGVGVSWRFGLANLFRHGLASIVQTCAIGLGLCAVLLLTVVRLQLFSSWQNALAPDTPNTFLINIQPAQRKALQHFLARELPSGRAPALYPMATARLVAIKDQPVATAELSNPVARRRLRGTVNVSWAAQPAPGSRLAAGRWWSSDASLAEVSLAQGWAKSLGVAPGDHLSFKVGEGTVRTVVSNLRQVDWDSFRVNFFIVLKPGVFPDAARSYLASFHLRGEDNAILASLARRFPNVNVIDAGALISQVQRVMALASSALNAVFLFTLLAGGLVLATALSTTQDERGIETAVLKAMGAGRRRLLMGLNAEFIALGLLAGGTAAGGASLIAMLLARQVFDMPYQVDWRLLLWSTALGVLVVVLASRAGLRRVLNSPPARVLQAEV